MQNDIIKKPQKTFKALRGEVHEKRSLSNSLTMAPESSYSSPNSTPLHPRELHPRFLFWALVSQTAPRMWFFFPNILLVYGSSQCLCFSSSPGQVAAALLECPNYTARVSCELPPGSSGRAELLFQACGFGGKPLYFEPHYFLPDGLIFTPLLNRHMLSKASLLFISHIYLFVFVGRGWNRISPPSQRKGVDAFLAGVVSKFRNEACLMGGAIMSLEAHHSKQSLGCKLLFLRALGDGLEVGGGAFGEVNRRNHKDDIRGLMTHLVFHFVHLFLGLTSNSSRNAGQWTWTDFLFFFLLPAWRKVKSRGLAILEQLVFN